MRREESFDFLKEVLEPTQSKKSHLESFEGVSNLENISKTRDITNINDRQLLESAFVLSNAMLNIMINNDVTTLEEINNYVEKIKELNDQDEDGDGGSFCS